MALIHYTDLNAVVSILTEPKLRFTDLRYLNDKAEFKHGVEQLCNAFTIVMPSWMEYHPRSKAAREYVHNALQRAVSDFSQYNPYFVMSLSRRSDLLSQWRGYGHYAIEFNEEELTRQIPSLRECIYGETEQQQAALQCLSDAIIIVSKDFQSNDVVGIKGAEAITTLYELASTFKNGGFVEEQETRLIVDEVPNGGIQYRVRGQMLIPYIERPITLDCIKAIHVGPMADQGAALLSMRGFCERIERDWQIESSNIEYWIEVIGSKIPFRA
ncbi:hypothetical protein GJ699_15595 [Duganella sp. FT80W]|uniref:DUF2971 domain-containing protein n=1 Tax=Duganella guangzhouensis TaxID=2666084 RepID=A0A6I2KZ23_9BURK|nr:DUF2971 domain-containing protein [Duganella guangzhouensis]MRW91415.1 hypothetical protein [Duganella guangzhouensis]